MGELDQMTGSTFYVNHKLSPILNAKPKPKFLGAIILDAVMNYNTSENSQVLPNGFDKVIGTMPEMFSKSVVNSLVVCNKEYISVKQKQKQKIIIINFFLSHAVLPRGVPND